MSSPNPTPAGLAGRAMATIAVVLGMMVALAGCVRMDGELTINGAAAGEPDTVSGTLVLAVSDEWAATHGEDPADLTAAVTEELEAAPDDTVTGEPYAQDGFTGVALTMDEMPIERLEQASENTLRLTKQGQTYVFEGNLSGVVDSEDSAASADIPWSVDLALTFPSSVAEHNGTLSGRTVTWNLAPDSADLTLYATSAVGPVAWWTRVPAFLYVLVGLAAVGAVTAWLLSRRESRREGEAGGFRARQARARGASTTGLDDMLGPARGRTITKATRPGPKPRGGSRGRR